MTTKIKILIRILAIGIVLLGGWLIWSNQIYSEPQEVTITTNKTEYEQGEIVEITIRNGLDRPIWYIKETCPPSCCNLHKWENDDWKNLGDPMPCIQVVAPLGGGSHFTEPDELKPGEGISKQWDMSLRELPEGGKYRLSFYYGLSKDNFTEKIIYSNEFKIKEKTTQEVIVTTDKTEYRQGEKVKISLDYEGDLYVWDYPWFSWSIQRKVKDSWVDLQLGFTTFGFSKYEKECKDVPPNKIVECEIYQLEAPAWSLRKGRTIIFTWDQRYIKGQGTYQCSYKDKISTRKCVIYEQVSLGEYKIRLEYALNIKNTHIKEGVDIKYAEKEFEIK